MISIVLYFHRLIDRLFQQAESIVYSKKPYKLRYHLNSQIFYWLDVLLLLKSPFF